MKIDKIVSKDLSLSNLTAPQREREKRRKREGGLSLTYSSDYSVEDLMLSVAECDYQSTVILYDARGQHTLHDAHPCMGHEGLGGVGVGRGEEEDLV